MEEPSGREEPAADGEPASDRRTQSSAPTGPAADGRTQSASQTGPAGDRVSAAPRRRVLDPRHVKIIEAFVGVAAEDGFAGAVVGRVCERTGMACRTFYECFTGREGCFAAVLDQAKETAVEIVAKAFDREEHPGDGLRAALAALLVFLDEEPRRARVLLVESLAAGQRTLELRERILADLQALILARLPAKDSPSPPPYTAEAATGAALALLHARVVEGKPAPFIEMLGPAMGIIAFAHLKVPAVKREIEHGNELARRIAAGDPRWVPVRPRKPGADDAMPAMLARKAQRPRDCLRFLADHPDSSNRETADGIGIARKSQISLLLRRLVEENLVAGRSEGLGKRSAWRLTPRGEEMLRALAQQSD
jgi:AcrR family transcriptional regulator